MRKIALLFAALFAFSVGSIQAQINPDRLVRAKGHLSDGDGNILTDATVQQIIGSSIYNETYLGATKQYAAGTQLITWGIISSGAGLISAISGVALALIGAENNNYTLEEIGVYSYSGGAVLAGVGSCLLAAGIPLKIIGKSRLNWVADDFNVKQNSVSLNVTGCSAGPGLGVAIVF